MVGLRHEAGVPSCSMRSISEQDRAQDNVANTRSTTCFSIYQLYLKIKDMKIWQQALTQKMKLLISPILKILTLRKPLHS